MQAERLTVDRDEARRIWRKYQEHRLYSTPVDREIAHAYQLLAQGRVVIRALESIRVAGLGADMLPKLAIVRADATHCYLNSREDGGGRMATKRWVKSNEIRCFIDFPSGTFPGVAHNRFLYEAMTPLVPVAIRPRRGLENYHILFEAEWSRTVPKDPMLLRRIGAGDLWTVLAHWDLTEVERAVLAGRLNG
jgi:hypothetical protein